MKSLNGGHGSVGQHSGHGHADLRELNQGMLIVYDTEHFAWTKTCLPEVHVSSSMNAGQCSFLGQKVQTRCLFLFDWVSEWQHNADSGAVLVGGMEWKHDMAAVAYIHVIQNMDIHS